MFIDFGRRAALAGATGCDRLGVGVLSPTMLSMRKRMSDSRSNRLRPLPLGASLAVSMRNGDEAQSSSCARLLAHERFAVIVVLRDVGSAFCPLLSAEHVWSRPRSAASTASHSSCAALLGGDAGFAPRRRFGEPIVTIVSRSLKAANMTQATSPWPVSTPGFQVGVPRQTNAGATGPECVWVWTGENRRDRFTYF